MHPNNKTSVDKAHKYLIQGDFIDAIKIYDVLYINNVNVSYESSNWIIQHK
ncbi:5780_t:CDS:2 [Gigaspora margarita]|uniref:5780_t:CDS:1 n=1 Tax=Gigaspora margarita TaxID=4874 RepID=A0ABN7X4U7_GIGMA|nr:5780_t:CDS:2 [Gigaspora margarita]